MTELDFIKVYGENPDFDKIPALELYKFIDGSRETWEALHEEGLLASHWMYDSIRRRTITDIYFLTLFLWDSNPFGGFDADISTNTMNPDNHQHVIDMFVKKDPDKSLSHLSEYKTRLTLYPRGSQKSSWGIMDIIQWVLYDYKIRILVLSSADDLAAEIVNEARGYFKINEARPSLLNMFWSEHCLFEKDLGPEGSFTTPKWTKQGIDRRESTIMSRGVTASVQGFHFEIFEVDDMVESRNSSEEQCLTTRKKFQITRKALRNFGYAMVRGTRYHEQDAYGEMLSKMELGEYKAEEFSITEKRISNLSRRTIALIGAAMTIKPDAEVEMVKFNISREQWFRKAGKDGVVLLIPGIPTLTYDALLVEYEDGPAEFETQQRQNVVPPTQQKFTREMILRNTVNWCDIPPLGRVTQCWDLNGGKGKKDNDFCVGTACLWDSKGVGYIVDLVCSNFPTPIAIAKAIVQFARKHHPDVLSIEDSLGVRNLAPTIEREADETNDKYVQQLVRRIYWRPVDTSKDAKRNRIDSLFPLIQYGRIKFTSVLPDRERMIEQFLRPVTKSSKNDIPDCISFQRDFLPNTVANPEAEEAKQKVEKSFQIEQARQKASWEMLYTENQGIPFVPQIYETQAEEYLQQSYSPYADEEGMENVLGFGITG